MWSVDPLGFLAVLHIVLYCRGKVHSFALNFVHKKGAPRGYVKKKKLGEHMFLLKNFNMKLQSNTCIELLFEIPEHKFQRGPLGF